MLNHQTSVQLQPWSLNTSTAQYQYYNRSAIPYCKVILVLESTECDGTTLLHTAAAAMQYF